MPTSGQVSSQLINSLLFVSHSMKDLEVLVTLRPGLNDFRKVILSTLYLEELVYIPPMTISLGQ